MSTTADEGRTPPPRRSSVTPEHDDDHVDGHDDRYRDDGDAPYDDDDEPYERSSIADVREAAKVPIRHIFKRFWPDTKPFRGRMFLSLLLVAVGPALGTLNIYLFKVLVDDIITPQDFRLFPLVAGAFLAITVVGGLINFGDEYMTAWVGEKFVMGLRQRVFDHMHRLSSGYFETRQLGDLLSRLTGDVSSIEQLMLSGVNMALTYSFQIVFYAGAMFILNWQLTLAALVAAPIFLLIARSFSRRIQSAARESRRRAGSISAVAEESFGNVALVQAYDRADHESRRFRDQNLGNFRAQMRAIKIEGLFSPISAFVESVGTLVVIGIGVWELSQNRITLGGLLVFLAYISQLYGPVQGFAGLTNSIFAASASAERIIEVLDAEPGVEEPAEPVRMRRARGDIRITGVQFAYPGTDRTALDDVDLDITAGTKVAVVGASGAGKSTLTKLLLRTYDPDAGTITLDDVDLRDLKLSDLRRNITAVLQETLVFDGSIADNIRWGRPDATDEDVATAAAAADAHDFVTRLPDGYDTRIGQRGRMLSGGQRQRIAIARAMIRDAPVLLLDEPTTGLDAESTRRVLEPLRRLMDGRTTVIISHNLITVTDADEIVYVEDGTVSARGSHEKLLATSPGYAHLYRLHHPDDAAAPAPSLEKAPAAAAVAPVPRPRVAPAPRGDREREDSTRPVPVPFRRPEHAGPPAPRRYVAMPVAGAPAAPPTPRRVDEPRAQAPAGRPEVYASAGRGVEETSLLGTTGRRPVPGPGAASEWAPGNAGPQRSGSGRHSSSGSSGSSSGSEGADATRTVRPVRPADTGPRRPDGPRDDRPRDDRPRDDRPRDDRPRDSRPRDDRYSDERSRDDRGRDARGRDDRRGPRDERDGGRGREVNGYRQNGSPADGSRADGSRVNGVSVNGVSVNGSRADGSRADGSRADGSSRNGHRADRPSSDDSRINGRRADVSRDDRSRSDAAESRGSRGDGARDDRARTDRPYLNGAQADHSRTDDPRTNGVSLNGSRVNGVRPDDSDDHRPDTPRTNGSRINGSQVNGSRRDGEERNGYAGDDARPARPRRRDEDSDERRPRRRRTSDDRRLQGDRYRDDRHRDDRHRDDRPGYDDTSDRSGREGTARRRRDTGAHRTDGYDDDRRRSRTDAPDPGFGTGADEVSATTALPRRPARRDSDDRYPEDRPRHARATRRDRDRDRDEGRGDRTDRGSRHGDDRRRSDRSPEERQRRNDRTRRDDRRTSDDRRARHDRPTRDDRRAGDDRYDDRRRDQDRDRRPADVDSPTAALPLVHLTQAFAKLTVPDPRVPDDDVDSETTAFRPIPRPRRRSWLTGELPKVPPTPPRRR